MLVYNDHHVCSHKLGKYSSEVMAMHPGGPGGAIAIQKMDNGWKSMEIFHIPS